MTAREALGADQCPDCDRAPQPTHPFAPGVIQGPDLPIVFMEPDDDAPLLPLTLADAVWLLGTVAVLGFVAGWLVERLV
ncbi:MAG: hypothetical protein IPN53_15255 [Comamonadaceae bacterium]|nr:hypothetical protein [Comamonadaceae bacterium]